MIAGLAIKERVHFVEERSLIKLRIENNFVGSQCRQNLVIAILVIAKLRISNGVLQLIFMKIQDFLAFG